MPFISRSVFSPRLSDCSGISPAGSLPRGALSLPTTSPWPSAHAEIPVLLPPVVIGGLEDSLAFGFSAAAVTTPSFPSRQWLLPPLAAFLPDPLAASSGTSQHHCFPQQECTGPCFLVGLTKSLLVRVPWICCVLSEKCQPNLYFSGL